ncbi:MAG: hypothetical protein MHM6MM_006514 [Cercozoa sp. M6MM]
MAEYNMPVGVSLWAEMPPEALWDNDDPSKNVLTEAFPSVAFPNTDLSAYALMSFEAAFFVQLRQIGASASHSGCEAASDMNLLTGCPREGHTSEESLSLMVFNLDDVAFRYGVGCFNPLFTPCLPLYSPITRPQVRLLKSSEVVYSHGPIDVVEGAAESKLIQFRLPSIPAKMEGSDASFSLQVLSVRNDTDYTNPATYASAAATPINTGYRISYALCPDGMEPSSQAPDWQVCQQCPRGAVSRGGVACAACVPGTYAVNGSTCVDCGAFEFNPLSSATECAPCFGSNTIVATDGGSFEPALALATCVECPRGQYTPRAGGRVVGPCVVCPDGAECFDGRVSALADYWIDVDKETGEVGAYRCKTGQLCLAGSECDVEYDEDGDELPRTCCGANRESPTGNRLCGECQDGYYEWGNSCIRCDNDGSVIGNLVVVAVMYILYVEIVHYLAKNLRDASVRIMMYYVQMSKLFAGAIDVSLSGWVAKLFFGLFQLDIVALTGGSMCYGRVSAMSRIWVSVLTPVFTMGMLGFLLAMRLILMRFLRHERTSISATLAAFRRTALYLLIGSYAAVLDVVIQVVFGCTDAGLDGVQVLKSYPSVTCTSTAYLTTRLFLVVIGLVFGLGIPAWLMFIMRRRLRRQRLFTLEAQQRIGVLTEVYRPQYYFWEPLVLLRRTLLLVIVFVNVSQDETRRMLFLVGACTTVFLAVQLCTWPYRRASDNVMELLVLLSHLLTVLGLSTASEPMTQAQSNLFAVWVLLSSFLLVLCLIAVKSLGWRHRRGERMNLLLPDGNVDIKSVRVMRVDSDSSLLRRMMARFVELCTCAPLARLSMMGRPLDEVLATRLVSPRDFDKFDEGGGIVARTPEVLEKSRHKGVRFMGGLTAMNYDAFDVERNQLLGLLPVL